MGTDANRRAREHFAAIPFRVFDALQQRQLSPGQALLLMHLIYRCRRDGGSTAATLKQLIDELGLSCTTESVRKDVQALHGGDWIEAETPGTRPGYPWRFKLLRAALDCSTSTLTSTLTSKLDPPSQLEVTSNGGKSEDEDFPF